MRSFLLMSACVFALALLVPPASTAAPTLPHVLPFIVEPIAPGLTVAPAANSATPAIPIAVSASDVVAAPTFAVAPSSDVAARWAANDALIASGEESRSWTWGPQIFRSAQEPYAEAPGGSRNVWYLDKARMEITNPDADPDESWFVTSGLLVRELISGQIQVGNAAYESRASAEVPIAGDLEAPLDQAITYADLKPLASLDNDRRAAVRTEFDTLVDETIGKNGVVSQDQRFHQYEVHLGTYDEVLTSQGFWRTRSDAGSVRVRVEVDVELLDEPVEDAELRLVGIDDLEVQRQPFMANPSFMTREQLRAVDPLLPPWPAAPEVRRPA